METQHSNGVHKFSKLIMERMIFLLREYKPAPKKINLFCFWYIVIFDHQRNIAFWNKGYDLFAEITFLYWLFLLLDLCALLGKYRHPVNDWWMYYIIHFNATAAWTLLMSHGNGQNGPHKQITNLKVSSC